MKRKHITTGKVHKPNYAEAVAIADELRKHCRLEDGFATYDKGMDDARVAEAVGPFTTKENVASMRTQIIGPMRAVRGPSRTTLAAREKAELLELRLEALEQWASRRPKEPFNP